MTGRIPRWPRFSCARNVRRNMRIRMTAFSCTAYGLSGLRSATVRGIMMKCAAICRGWSSGRRDCRDQRSWGFHLICDARQVGCLKNCGCGNGARRSPLPWTRRDIKQVETLFSFPSKRTRRERTRGADCAGVQKQWLRPDVLNIAPNVNR